MIEQNISHYSHNSHIVYQYSAKPYLLTSSSFPIIRPMIASTSVCRKVFATV